MQSLDFDILALPYKKKNGVLLLVCDESCNRDQRLRVPA